MRSPSDGPSKAGVTCEWFANRRGARYSPRHSPVAQSVEQSAVEKRSLTGKLVSEQRVNSGKPKCMTIAYGNPEPSPPRSQGGGKVQRLGSDGRILSPRAPATYRSDETHGDEIVHPHRKRWDA